MSWSSVALGDGVAGHPIGQRRALPIRESAGQRLAAPGRASASPTAPKPDRPRPQVKSASSGAPVGCRAEPDVAAGSRALIPNSKAARPVGDGQVVAVASPKGTVNSKLSGVTVGHGASSRSSKSVVVVPPAVIDTSPVSVDIAVGGHRDRNVPVQPPLVEPSPSVSTTKSPIWTVAPASGQPGWSHATTR